MIGYTGNELVFIFLFWGVVGWLIEVVDMRIEAGEFQNRGFLHMPLCPLYGIGMLLMCITFRNENSAYLLLFAAGMFVGSFVEYLVGWLLETLFNTKWWDYSHMNYQLNGRVCLRNTVLFGFGAIITIGFIQPVIDRAVGRIPTAIGQRIVSIVVIVLLIDIISSVLRAFRYKRENETGKVFMIFKSHK